MTLLPGDVVLTERRRGSVPCGRATASRSRSRASEPWRTRSSRAERARVRWRPSSAPPSPVRSGAERLAPRRGTRGRRCSLGCSPVTTAGVRPARGGHGRRPRDRGGDHSLSARSAGWGSTGTRARTWAGHGPYRQSQRFDIYREVAATSGPGRGVPVLLHARRSWRSAAGRRRREASAPGYDGRCRDPDDERRARGRGPPVGAAVRHPRARAGRLRRPGQGRSQFEHARSLRDFVIVRSDGSPTYLLAAASTT